VPVVPYGAATSLEGHVIPVAGGVSLDTSRLEPHPRDRLPPTWPRSCQPGVKRLALNERLGREGLQFPVDPGADATLGGMAATNASGTTTVRYGGMRAHVLALEVVLPGAASSAPGAARARRRPATT
jgi:D-lactate dehydrogenase (cytochrome)